MEMLKYGQDPSEKQSSSFMLTSEGNKMWEMRTALNQRDFEFTLVQLKIQCSRPKKPSSLYYKPPTGPRKRKAKKA